jgi:hypothetical protein
MKKPISRSELYLRTLAKDLECLGPSETKEIVAEVRSHIADAVSETDNEESALGRFGSPADMAAQILKERGVIVEDSTIPEAARWRRGLGLAIDIAVSLLGLYLGLFFLAVGTFLPGGEALWWEIPLACLELLACVAVLIWLPLRWIRERRRGAGTLGMRVVQIRRVRIGHEKRVVRNRDIPGLTPTKAGRVAWGFRTLWAVVITVLVVFIIWGMVINSTSSSDGRRDVDRALEDGVRYAVSAMSTVAGLYDSVTSGASPDKLTDWLSPDAAAIGTQLVSRLASGQLGSHDIWSAELLEYTWPEPALDEVGQTYTLRMKVVVGEYAKGSDIPVTYEYVVAFTLKCDFAEDVGSYTSSGSSGSWAVTSVRLQDDQ